MHQRKEFSAATDEQAVCEVFAAALFYKIPAVLRIVSSEDSFEILFQSQRIAFATSSRAQDQLPPILVELGLVTAEAVSRLAPKWNLPDRDTGAVFIEAGLIGPTDLIRALRFQVIRIIYAALSTIRAEIHFRPGLPRSGEGVIKLNINATQILYEAVRTIIPYDVLTPLIPHEDARMGMIANREPDLSDINFLPGEQAVISLLSGERSIGQLRKSSPLASEDTDRFIAFLNLLRVLNIDQRFH